MTHGRSACRLEGRGLTSPLRKHQDVESRSRGTASKQARSGYFSTRGPRRSHGNQRRLAGPGLGFFGGTGQAAARTARPVPDPARRTLLRARTSNKHRSDCHINSQYPMCPTCGGLTPILL
ncbi:hypothetical protein NDU88_010392 [Pleurodeles waltl]|uniref:Uncharacterized protein n=1 Tax=Pleurodeles waltl TaxID=8319 RepID=A0AAV7QVR4_PLEWA|nr:hypothetical protein NDU88_010392 [Pleurodeles waltl]